MFLEEPIVAVIRRRKRLDVYLNKRLAVAMCQEPLQRHTFATN